MIAFVKIADSISNRFIAKNSAKGINTRKRTALFIVVVYLFKNTLNIKVKILDTGLVENTGALIINLALVGVFVQLQ